MSCRYVLFVIARNQALKQIAHFSFSYMDNYHINNHHICFLLFHKEGIVSLDISYINYICQDILLYTLFYKYPNYIELINYLSNDITVISYINIVPTLLSLF